MTSEKRTAIVTGGSRGIGKAIALRLAKEGYNLVINYVNGKDGAEAVAKEAESIGAKTLVVQADISKAIDVERLFSETISEFGRLDVLVNNAGITRDNLLIRMSEKEFEDVLETNLKGAFLCTKAAAKPMMKQRIGRIINITSVVGIVGNAGQSNYAAAKAGLIGFTKSIAKELAKRNITVNAIAPGFIETEMTAVIPEKVRDTLLTGIPAGRPGKPEDVANAVAFLAAESSNYITGQVLNIDGGMVM